MLSNRITVLHVLPDLATGGGQQVVLQSLKRLDPERFRTLAAYFAPNHDMRDAYEAAGASVWCFPEGGWWSWPGVLRNVVRLIREQEVDLVHMQGTLPDMFYGQTAALICGIPGVRTLHGMWPEPTRFVEILRRPRPRRVLWYLQTLRQAAMVRMLDRWALKKVIAVSDAVLDSWKPYLHATGIPQDRVTLSYNGIPLEDFADAEDPGVLERLRGELGLQDAFPVLISVGRLHPGKGHELLMDMMPALLRRWPCARLLIVGEGDYRPTVERHLERLRLGGSVSLLGRREDVPSLLALADVFVFASYYEGCPLCVLEAGAASKPVVAVRIPALEPLVQEGVNGYLVPERSAETLGDRVAELIENPDLALRMGQGGRRMVEERFNADRSARELARIYEEVVRGNGIRKLE
jgi:glycosyltransferase involved in cell wall biosynthesis